VARRVLIGAAFVVGFVGLVLLIRQRRVPDPLPSRPGPATSRVSEPSPAPASASPRKTTRRTASTLPSDENFALFVTLSRQLQAQAAKETPRESFLRILRERELPPKDFTARVRRALMLSQIPGLAAADATLRSEAVAYLEGPCLDDADAFSRFAASAALLDCPVNFVQVRPDAGFFAPHLRDHAGEWALTPDAHPQLLSRLQQVFAREPDWENRKFLAQRLTEYAGEAVRPLLREAAGGDADADVRYWAMNGLTTLPPDDADRAAILSISGRDPSERNRTSALIGLVRMGYVDELVASRLAAIENKSEAHYEAIGRAHALSRLPLLEGVLKRDLASADPRVRSGAMEGIAAAAPGSFATELRTAAEQETDPALKQRLSELLAPPAPKKEP
jgi:hypothetical protein